MQTLTLPAILSESACAELVSQLERARDEKATRAVRKWDRDTGHACLVVVRDGEPIHWRTLGPVSELQAQAEFRAMDLRLVGSPSARAH